MHTYMISYNTKYTKDVLWVFVKGGTEIEACMNLFDVMPDAVDVTGCVRFV